MVHILFALLSHRLSTSTPGFAGEGRLRITPIKEISSGGSSNSYSIDMPCHLGTHVDAPRHFSDSGRPIASYRTDDLVFEKPCLLDIPLGAGELLSRDQLVRFERLIAQADILFIRTGFQRYRDTDASKYSSENPGVSADAARYLVGFKKLRAVGLDFISLSSALNREEGRTAHRELLSPRDFLLVEDMDLRAYPSRVRRVLVVPLLIEGVDSAPCTVLAEY
jgi:kynurenine formamidase